MRPVISFAWTIALGVTLGLLVGCGDGGDLSKGKPGITHSPSDPWFPDAGAEPAAPQWTGPKPDASGPVELASQPIIGDGMRSCAVNPPQQPGEFGITKNADGTGHGVCLNLAAGGSWDICNPTMHWYNGEMLNDNIRRINGNVPAGTCMRIRLYSEWMYGNLFYENKWCKPPWESGVLPFYAVVSPLTSSIRTQHYTCNATQWQQGCPPP